MNKKRTSLRKRSPKDFLLAKIEQKVKSLNYWKGKYLAVLEEINVASKSLLEIVNANKSLLKNEVNQVFKELNNEKVQENILSKTFENKVSNEKDLVEIDLNNNPQGFTKEIIDKEVLAEKKTVKTTPTNEETCDKCNKNLADCKCFEKSSQLPEKKREEDSEIIKVAGKINGVPQKGTDMNGLSYYWANFTDDNYTNFPIYLWDKPQNLSDKQKHRIQYWNLLVDGFKKLVLGSQITIEGYYWHKNGQLPFTLLGYHNEE